MAIHPVRRYPDPVLRKVAEKVTNISTEVRRVGEDMVETMHASRGIGLAANQIGVSLRIITLEVGPEKETLPLVLINPEIVKAASEEIAEEGCLSLPGYYETVRRARQVVVKAVTLEGKEFGMECEGLLARAFQHEIDHLSPVKRQLFRKEYMKE